MFARAMFDFASRSGLHPNWKIPDYPEPANSCGTNLGSCSCSPIYNKGAFTGGWTWELATDWTRPMMGYSLLTKNPSAQPLKRQGKAFLLIIRGHTAVVQGRSRSHAQQSHYRGTHWKSTIRGHAACYHSFCAGRSGAQIALPSKGTQITANACS